MFFGPFDQNELHHIPVLSKIWGLGARIFFGNDPFKFSCLKKCVNVSIHFFTSLFTEQHNLQRINSHWNCDLNEWWLCKSFTILAMSCCICVPLWGHLEKTISCMEIGNAGIHFSRPREVEEGEKISRLLAAVCGFTKLSDHMWSLDRIWNCVSLLLLFVFTSLRSSESHKV